MVNAHGDLAQNSIIQVSPAPRLKVHETCMRKYSCLIIAWLFLRLVNCGSLYKLGRGKEGPNKSLAIFRLTTSEFLGSLTNPV